MAFQNDCTLSEQHVQVTFACSIASSTLGVLGLFSHSGGCVIVPHIGFKNSILSTFFLLCKIIYILYWKIRVWGSINKKIKSHPYEIALPRKDLMFWSILPFIYIFLTVVDILVK